ncbi:hypothetical protein ASPCADRAFT_8031 [Aspergillus carbonarius ITEM 5010]|uniref:Protein kinase domain-containing protein n=1 Tax=Aspergillus carbonarius (strain ITEM 5010) TaxID=602072 RepID=A0A1R3RF36_ASPC5|nr:hypothetical protein ASPCADRAFT_8031 [Aspergillus carbonarius ITEM 5010]
MAIGPFEFKVVFTVPPSSAKPGEDPIQTIVHQCIDLYVNKSFKDLFTLLLPHILSISSAELAHPPTNLQSYMGRNFCFRLLPGVGDTVTCEPYPEFNPPPKMFDWDSLKDDLVNVPHFDLSDVKDFRQGLNRAVYQVNIKGKNFLYKPMSTPESFTREISILQRAAGLSLRIPKLEGVVNVNIEHSGMLLTLVPNCFPLSLWSYIQPEVSIAERQKWYDQISETLHALHQHDCCWGDAKNDNVVIDENRDAWLVDFGGGFSPGWVDPELVETVAGDLQGLQRIHEHLKLTD